MKIHAINAAEGDCLLLESSDASQFALIDGGPRGVFNRHLRPYLDEIVGPDGTLEAVIVSHVDADHISGILDLLAEVERGEADGDDNRLTVRDLWHNSFDQTLDGADDPVFSDLQAMVSMAGRTNTLTANSSIAFLGINQGAKLRRLALKLSIPMNQIFNGQLIAQETLAGVSWTLGGTEFTVVGPTNANLEELRREWKEWIEANLDAFALGDTQAMANADTSIPNLSSIVLFGTSPAGNILLTGDARGDHILQGLEQAGLISAGGAVPLRLLKVQHHGSDRNVEQDFFERLPADIYLVSADGSHGNPDVATLLMLVDAAAGRNFDLVLTNAPEPVQQLVAQRPPDQFGYRLFVRNEARHAIVIDLAAGTVS